MKKKQQTKKLAVTALIVYNEKVLAVSRKDNFTDFGLIGGKVDPGENLTYALVREVYEETGLTVVKFQPIFTREDDEYVTTTFLITKYIGHIVKREAGVIEWVDYSLLEVGSFGKYNRELKDFVQQQYGGLSAIQCSYETQSFLSIMEWANRVNYEWEVPDFDCDSVTLTHLDDSTFFIKHCKVFKFLVVHPFNYDEMAEYLVIFSEHHKPISYFTQNLKTLEVVPTVNK